MIITQQTPSPFHHLLILQSRVRTHPSSISFREHWSNFINSLCLHLKSLTSQIFIWPSLQSTALKKVHISCYCRNSELLSLQEFPFSPYPIQTLHLFLSSSHESRESPPPVTSALSGKYLYHISRVPNKQPQILEFPQDTLSDAPVINAQTQERTLTFVERPASQNIPPFGEARAPGAQSLVLLGAGRGAALAVGAPGSPHGAAAGIHPEPAGHGLHALVLVPPQVALLHANICTCQSKNQALIPLLSYFSGTSTHNAQLLLKTPRFCTMFSHLKLLILHCT